MVAIRFTTLAGKDPRLNVYNQNPIRVGPIAKIPRTIHPERDSEKNDVGSVWTVPDTTSRHTFPINRNNAAKPKE